MTFTSSKIYQSVKQGAWTPRLFVFAMMLLAISFSVLFVANQFHYWGERPDNWPAGPDFTSVWAAGIEARDGVPQNAYFLDRHYGEEKKLWGADAPYLGWHYPPFFQILATGLAFLPYDAALWIYLLSTLTLFVIAMRFSLKGTGETWGWTIMASLAFPGVALNFTHGQNGFLTAGLLTLGLLVSGDRPIIGGILLALLAYKPHLAILAPLALLASRQYRAFASAVVTFALMTGLTLLVLGFEPWRAFFENLTASRELLIEKGAIGWHRIQSINAGLRLLGAPSDLALFVQSAVGLVVLALVLYMWRWGVDRRLAVAATLTGGLLMAPYSLDYDMVLLGPAAALLYSYGYERKFVPWEHAIITLVCLTPALARYVGWTFGFPLGVTTLILFFMFLSFRARSSAAQPIFERKEGIALSA